MPERYIGDSAAAKVGIPHYTYDADLRMCAGYQLANQEFYVFLVRLIMPFEVIPPKDPKDRPILDAIHCSAIPTSLTLMPKPFKVGFKPRDRSEIEKRIGRSEAMTSHLLQAAYSYWSGFKFSKIPRGSGHHFDDLEACRVSLAFGASHTKSFGSH